MISPHRVLEIGTYTAYSSICLARGMTEKGILHTIEINDELYDMSKSYIEMAGLSSKIIMHTGDALKIIPGLDEQFELVFIDGNKQQYKDYYISAFPNIKTGGYIIADNVLWGGKVFDATAKQDKETKGIKEFNEFIKMDKRVEKIMLPFRDGLFIIRKTSN